jgi:uncharacterized protein involved in outer membrane biogenesis
MGTEPPRGNALAARAGQTLSKLRKTRRGSILLKAGLWVAGLIVLFAIVGFFVVPPVAKHYLVKGLSEKLHRQVTIDDIKINPFALTVLIKGFTIKERSSSEVFVSFSELFLDLQAESIYQRGPILREIRLANPYVRIVRNDDGTTYNFSDLLQEFSAPAEPPKKEDKDAKPPRFSLNNIQLINGRLEFDDRPKHARHTVTEINVAVPFLSNLDYLLENYVQPAFSARVNGTPFALHGRTKPFKDTLETAVDIDIARLDIPRYMEYVPTKLNFRVPSGHLTTKLTATFTRAKDTAPVLLVAGKIGLEKFSLAELDGQTLLNLPALDVPVDSVQVFMRKLAFGQIVLTAPEVFVRRSHDGVLNWTTLVPKDTSQPKEETAPKPAEAPSPSLEVSVSEVKISDGQVHFIDRVPDKGFRTDLQGIEFALKNFALPQTAPALIDLEFKTAFNEAFKHNSTLLISPLTSEGHIEISGVRPKNYAPYYAPSILFDVEDAVAGATTGYRFKQDGEDIDATVSNLNATLNALRLRIRGQKEDFLKIGTTALSGVNLDLKQRTVQVTEFQTKDARLNARRGKDGSIDLAQLTPAPQAGAKEPAPQPAKSAPEWRYLIKKVSIDRYSVTFRDNVPAEPVTQVIEPIKLTAENLSNRKGSAGKVALSARINKTGTLTVNGPVQINPIGAQLAVDLQTLDIVPLQPYFQDKVNIVISSGLLSTKGDVKVTAQEGAAPVVGFAGDVTMADFASVDKAQSEDFLKWKSLFIGGINTTTQPFALEIREIALTDFYSRLIIYPNGRLNVQDIMTSAEQRAAAESAEKAEAGAPGDASKPAESANSATQEKTQGDKVAEAPKSPSPAEQAPVPPIAIGKITLQGGDVNFTDLFIKPNYSADLTEIGGSVTGLSSALDTTADVDLRGRFAKTAPVEIKGKLNPLAKELFLDIKAGVRDIELGPFTPYSGKYVGYAIEKGKMTFNVEYKVENRKLAAKNQLILDQLTFGDKIESTTATKLPVQLAVALLKDRHGVINLNLPISGSLDDPKFNVGAIIVQVLFNLIEKAVTAPFALIGSMFGDSGEELAYVEYDPGLAVLTPESEEKLTKLQTALIDRPGLKLDITPRVDPEKDREGLRQYRFQQEIKAQKLKDVVKQGTSVKSVDEVKVDPAEYEKYLTKAYKAAKFPKPRNAIGIAKDLPPAEMEKLMLTNVQVSNEELVELANTRAQIAKNFITKNDQVPLERVFLLAPKVEASKADDKLKASRVDFSLK